jgi:hypothetical protein
MENKEMINNKDFLLSSLINEKSEKENEKEEIDNNKEIIFRNYIPQDRNLKIEKCYKTNEVKSIEDKIKANVLKSVKEFLSLEKNTNIIKPVKRDYDLKRNIAQKMNYLNSLTAESLKEMANKNDS